MTDRRRRDDTVRAVDLFCGAGGLSWGLASVCEQLDDGVDLAAVNHWERAIETHERNHPWADHYHAKVEELEPRNVFETERVDLLVAGPECTHFSTARGGRPVDEQKRVSPWNILEWLQKLYVDNFLLENVPEFCFPAGTLVLTDEGLLPIEDVEEGMRVLTHENRWKEVTDTMSRKAETVNVQGVGNRLLECTPDHPIYAREVGAECSGGKSGRHVQQLARPDWVQAAELVPNADDMTTYEEKYSGHKWATPTEFADLPVPECPVERVDSTTSSFYRMIGVWLGDGWVHHRRGRADGLRICGNKDEADDLESQLREVGGLTWNRQERESVDVFQTTCKNLAQWLSEHFGEHSDSKTIPAWVFSLPAEHRRALAEGYQQADGHTRENDDRVRVNTTSKQLAVGMKLVLESLGVPANVTGPYERDEEGHNPIYVLNWRWDPENTSTSTWDSGHRWSRVQEIEPAADETMVYDLTVKDDSSFVADGVVVHNCNWGPVGADGTPMKSKKGETFEAYVDALHSLGYNVDWTVLNAADYGDATSRKRMFLVGRRQYRPDFPDPTHSENGEEPGTEPWRPAREIIDWSDPGESIWERNRPLVNNTMQRIAEGIRRHGDDELEPYAEAVAELGKDDVEAMQENAVPVDELDDVVEQRCEPFLVKYYGTSTARPVHKPVDTITSGGQKFALCVPYLLGQQSGSRPQNVNEDPVPTIATKGAISKVEPYLVPFYGERAGQDPRTHDIDDPLPTVPASKSPAGVARPYLIQYNGQSGAQSLEEPLPTVTTKDRFALCLPEHYPWGLDIRFRMLQPRELAAAMGFPEDYEFTGTKTETIEQIGNAVPVNLARSLIECLLTERDPTLSSFDTSGHSEAEADD